MTLAVQLRAAMEYTRDRLAELATEQEALEFVVAAIQDALTLRDLASVPLADGGAGATGEEQPSPSAISPAAPIAQPGSGRGDNQPATGSQTPATTAACPECGKVVDPRGLGTHRRHLHGHKAAPAKAPVTCSECGEVIAQRKNMWRHRQTHRASDPVAVPVAPIELVLRKGAETPVEEPITRHWPKRPTIAERIAQRDAGRVGRRPARAYPVGGGE